MVSRTQVVKVPPELRLGNFLNARIRAEVL
jgi:hypothetical protein